MTKDQMFNFIVDHKVQILRHPPMKWVREDGTEYFSTTCVSYGNKQLPGFATLEETMEFANTLEKRLYEI